MSNDLGDALARLDSLQEPRRDENGCLIVGKTKLAPRTKRYIVLTELRLGYGSHTRRLSPTHYKWIGPGRVVYHECTAPDGTVWFYDDEGDRGKSDSGSIRNIVERGAIRLLEGVS